MDGGVGPKTIGACARAGKSYFVAQWPPIKRLTGTICSGSNVIVAGTAIFGANEPEQVIAILKSTVDEAQARVSADPLHGRHQSV